MRAIASRTWSSYFANPSSCPTVQRAGSPGSFPVRFPIWDMQFAGTTGLVHLLIERAERAIDPSREASAAPA